MKRNKILILSLGIISITSIPVMALVSCGDTKNIVEIIPVEHVDENKMKSITSKQVQEAITNRLKEFGTPLEPKDWSTTLNGLDGVFIHIQNWNPTEGSVTMNATIYKPNVTAREFTDIIILGFSYIPHIVAVSPVPSQGKNLIPSVKNGFSLKINPTHYLVGTESAGVYQVALDSSGIVTTSIQVPTSGTSRSIPDVGHGWAQEIGDSNHYLIGTKTDGVYQVTVDNNGMVTKSGKVSNTLIPSVKNGFIQKLDDLHYLVGTESDGMYEVVVAANGIVQSATKYAQLPLVAGGWSQRLDSRHYWIGTATAGMYLITMNVAGTTIRTSTLIANTIVPDVGYGFSQKIADSNHYLIGTTTNGVYEVTVDIDSIIISHHQVPTTDIPNVANSFITKLDDSHYLIATSVGGIYGITVDNDGKVSSSVKIPKNVLPSVTGGWAQQIDATHYLIGTETKGVYQVKVSYFI